MPPDQMFDAANDLSERIDEVILNNNMQLFDRFQIVLLFLQNVLG